MADKPGSHPAHEVGPPAAEANGILTIDLSALVANYRDLAERAAPASCAAVVKADGYGCGLAEVTVALANAGCATFFVADLREARAARSAAPAATIYVLSGLPPGTADTYCKHNLRPVIGSRAELAEWLAHVHGARWTGGAALQVDTGMNRLGFTFDEAAALAQERAWKDGTISLVMSHFACSEEPDHPLNARQMATFREVRALFPRIPGSIANSSGIFLGPDAHHDMVRPGAALYGTNPTPHHPNPMRAVVNLQGRVVQVRKVPTGDAVGYGSTWTAKRPTRLAIVGVGYADGFLRAASGSDTRPGGETIVAGQECPLAGRVSMDLLAVDVTDVPEGAVHRGDFVTLLNDQITIDDLAARGGTISYEVLTSLGRRYRRIYRGG